MAESKPTAYIETTIPSYLTAWPSRELTMASQQLCTKEWWKTAMQRYELLISATVLDEASRGDPDAASRRMAELATIPLLPEDPRVISIATEYVAVLALPRDAQADAVHLANAVIFELDYLVTWNMRHLANSLTMRKVTAYNKDRSLWTPLIVTPQYLLDLEQQEQP